MEAIRRNPGPTLIGQSLDPWLDQVALPLVLTELGGGRPSRELVGLDGPLVCHWRVLPLAYARETDETIETLERIAAPNRIKKILKRNEAMLRMIYQGRGRKVRALFDREALPPREAAIRRRIREAGHWIR